MAEIKAVILERHQGDVRHRRRDLSLAPPAVAWTELGWVPRTAEPRRGTSLHGIAAPDDSCGRSETRVRRTRPFPL